MAGILVFSPKCKHCVEIINFINSHKMFQNMIEYHNINTDGLPSDKISRVPTMVTKNGKTLVGNEVKAWLASLLPNEISNCTLGKSSCGACSLESNDDEGGFFSLESYGQSLQPVLTPELQSKINRNVSDAFSNGNKD